MNRASGSRNARWRTGLVVRAARAGIGAAILVLGGYRCTIDRAHGEPPATATADGAAGASPRRPQGGQPPPPAQGHPARPATEPNPAGDSLDNLIGLTHSQVKARRGAPTTVRGAAWIYTSEQPGCRETIISEVVTFNKRGVVASVELERRRTNKMCGHDGHSPLRR